MVRVRSLASERSSSGDTHWESLAHRVYLKCTCISYNDLVLAVDKVIVRNHKCLRKAGVKVPGSWGERWARANPEAPHVLSCKLSWENRAEPLTALTMVQ